MEELGHGPAMVQMAPLLAPLKSSQGGQYLPTTPVVGIAHGDELAHFCQLLPRIRDAVIAVLYENPVVMGPNGPIFTTVNPLVQKSVETAMGEKDFITEVRLLPGSMQEGEAKKLLSHDAVMASCQKSKKKSGKEKEGVGSIYKPEKPKAEKPKSEKKSKPKAEKKSGGSSGGGGH
ncbi:MAG: hypothetical protein ABT940_00680 [Alphaproteobacteria bacterium]